MSKLQESAPPVAGTRQRTNTDSSDGSRSRVPDTRRVDSSHGSSKPPSRLTQSNLSTSSGQAGKTPSGEKSPTSSPKSTQRTIRTLDIRNVPLSIKADIKKQALWDDATDDEKYLSVALCDLRNKSSRGEMTLYYDFADVFEKHFPKEDKTKFQHGKQAVKMASVLADYSASWVYQVLATTQLYRRDDVAALEAKAVTNGQTLKWTFLRLIAWRLSGGKYRSVRKQIEKEITTTKYTESKLKALIDELAPDTVKEEKAKVTESVKTGRTPIASFIVEFGKNVKNYQTWMKAITSFESEFKGESKEEIEVTLKQVNDALDIFQQTEAFINESREILNIFQQEVSHLSQSTSKADTEKVSEEIKQKLQAEKQHAALKQKQREERLALRGGFSDSDEEDDRPKTVIRDEPDEDSTSYAEDDSTEDWSDTESDDNEYDTDGVDEDDQELDEDDDRIFDEIGNVIKNV